MPSEAPLFSLWAAVLEEARWVAARTYVCVWMMYERMHLSAVYENLYPKRKGRSKESLHVKKRSCLNIIRERDDAR